MVGVAQSVELWIVAPAVAGSNPVAHPIFFHVKGEVAPTVDTLLKIATACQISQRINVCSQIPSFFAAST